LRRHRNYQNTEDGGPVDEPSEPALFPKKLKPLDLALSFTQGQLVVKKEGIPWLMASTSEDNRKVMKWALATLCLYGNMPTIATATAELNTIKYVLVHNTLVYDRVAGNAVALDKFVAFHKTCIVYGHELLAVASSLSLSLQDL
jgi:hypothetical protein